MDELQVMISFARDATHLREAGAALALCGAPVAGLLLRRFLFIGQVDKCRDCIEEASRRKYNEKK